MSSPQSFGLMSLPTEIRINILEYILPLNKDGSKSITFTISQYPITDPSKPPNTSKHTWAKSPSTLALKRYLKGISLVNRQLHSESARILYDRIFILEFREFAFLESGEESSLFDARVSVDPPWTWRWGKSHPGDRRGGDFFPGLHFSRMRELRVVVRPSDAVGYWACVAGSVESLCRALRPRIAGQGLKKLGLVVCEVEQSREHKYWWCWSWDSAGTQSADVMALLQVPWLYLRGVGKCEVLLPACLSSDGALAEAVSEMKSAVGGPWTVGDLAASAADEELAWAEKPFTYTRRSVKEVSWSDTRDIPTMTYFKLWDDILENPRYFQVSEEKIPSTEMTVQDREARRFELRWDLLKCIERWSGLLVRGMYAGLLWYYWESYNWSWSNDENMWKITDWETEDDFYRTEHIEW